MGYYSWKEANRLFQCTGGEGCSRNGWKQTELMSGMVGTGEVEKDYQEALRAS